MNLNLNLNQLVFVFQSTLHSSQSSKVRFMSHPAAFAPGNNPKHNVFFLGGGNTTDKDLQMKTFVFVLTFDKWLKNFVHHLVTLMHHFPVTF